MTVIIPHPDVELKIVKIQQELLKHLFNSAPDFIFFKNFPLWIQLNNLSDEKQNLKNTAKTIKKVSFGRFQYENNKIFMEVTIITEKENIKNRFTEKLVLLQGSKKNLPDNDFQQHSEITKKITTIMEEINNILHEEQDLKIFRLGTVHEISENSKGISDSIWCKLK